MATEYGVTAQGYKAMAFTDVKADLEAALQSAFGNNVNLAPSSVNGQYVGIMAERLTLLWQLGQSVYNANNPSAASGVALDNIAALNGLSRLAARPTVTEPQPVQTSGGVTLYGLVLYGSPGTLVPQGSLISNGQPIPVTFSLDADVTIGAASNSRQSLIFSNQPTGGSYALVFNDASGNTATASGLTYGMVVRDPTLNLGSNTGTFTLTLAQSSTQTQSTQPLDAKSTAAQVQTAIQSLPGYANVTVQAASAGALAFHFPDTPTPQLSVSGLSGASVSNALQGIVNTLTLADGTTQPFTDVAVSSTASGLQFDFGGGTVQSGQKPSAASAIPLIAIGTSTLIAGSNVTNLTVLESRVGAPAQGIGSATATITGENTVLAGTLTTIVTPKIGWTGVTNQLDCNTGADTETDEALLSRLQAVRASQGSGSLASIVERVRLVPGVTASIGFQNLTNAAQQVLTFLGTATSGSFQLSTTTGVTKPIPYNAMAADVAAALMALPGFAQTRVTGTAAYGFVVDFNGAQGGQAQPLLTVLNNSTGVTLSADFGRPPHTVELVVAGGADQAVAQAIIQALPAGMGSYGAPVESTLGTVAQGSNQLTLASSLGAQAGLTINMPGVPVGTMVASVADNVLTMTAAALSTQNSVPCTLTHAPLLVDSAGNSQLVAFSRPTPTLIYVQILIVTDQYVTPGLPSSGINAASKWNPASVATIQANVLNIGNAIPIGGLVVAQGTNGLVGCFNSVPGIVSYKLTFGTGPNPVNTDNISLQPSQAPTFEAANVAVAYT